MQLKRVGLCLLLSAAIFAGALWGQGGTGRATLVGTVKDPTGSVVPLAKVKVVNAATSFVTETTASEQGAYYLPNLDPGTYRLTAALSARRRRPKSQPQTGRASHVRRKPPRMPPRAGCSKATP